MEKITFKGNPITLVGRCLKLGQNAPPFKVSANDLKETGLSDFNGKIKILSVFPSIDTPVCDLQVKEFNKKATELSLDIVILGISKDLPFAQKRFCDANNIKNVITLSDYKNSTFGINYGLLIKEMNLLARAVIILDKSNIIRYIQIVKELSTSPDYQDVLRNLAEIEKNPQAIKVEGLPSHTNGTPNDPIHLGAQCKPCEEGTLPLPKDKVEKLLAIYRGWQLVEDKKIVKEFKFRDFVEAKYFLDLISIIAEEQKHHPSFTLIYNKLKITLTTHTAGGLTENDFIMARAIDEVGQEA